MKTYTTVTIQQSVLKTIACNCCGKEVKENDYETLLNFKCWFGYFAQIFEDGEKHDIDVCEECYSNWIKTFKIAPDGFERDFEEWKKSQ
jgi:hypothetical protein